MSTNDNSINARFCWQTHIHSRRDFHTFCYTDGLFKKSMLVNLFFCGKKIFPRFSIFFSARILISATNSRLWNIDGEKLSNLRFTDNVALTTEDVRDMEYQWITVNKESLKIGVKIHKGKTKFMTNIVTTDNIQINGTEIEKVTNYKYLGQTIEMENSTKQEVSIRIIAGWSIFGKYREIFLNRHLPMSLKRKVSNQCVLPAMTYGCQTRSLTKALISKETRNKPTSYGKENA